MVDVGLIIGAVAIILAILALGLGGYSLTQSDSGEKGSPGAVGPPGPPGIAGTTEGGTTCQTILLPTCGESAKLKLLLNYMDITNNQLVFTSRPTFNQGLYVPNSSTIGLGELNINKNTFSFSQ